MAELAAAEDALYRAQRARPALRRARLQAYRAQVLREASNEIRPCCSDCAEVLEVLAASAQSLATA